MDAAEHHKKVQDVLATLLIEGGAVRPRDISVLSLENETVVLEYRDDTVDPNARPSMPVAWEKLRSAVEGAGLSVTMRREEVEPPSLPQVSVDYSYLADDKAIEAFKTVRSVINTVCEAAAKDPTHEWSDELIAGVNLLNNGLVAAYAPPRPVKGGFLVQLGIFADDNVKEPPVILKVAAVHTTEALAVTLLLSALAELPFRE